MPLSQELRKLPVAVIEPNLAQPRRYFDEGMLRELADSVSERGVLQPVLVRPRDEGRYELVAGERRWRAARIAGLNMVPALVSRYDDLAALEVGLIENMARENLNPVEEARACTTLVKEFGLTQEKVARRVGRSRAMVSNILRLLDLSEEILELLERGQLSRSHGEALLIAQDPQVRRQLADAAVQHGWSVRTLKANAGQSNNAVPAQRQGRREQGHDLDVTALNVARVWGDALGAEVTVRNLPSRKLRVELVFDSPEGAFAFGGRIGEKIAQGTKRN
jgi:ParB family transcriptional regulator, chromosome partitioning protein